MVLPLPQVWRRCLQCLQAPCPVCACALPPTKHPSFRHDAHVTPSAEDARATATGTAYKMCKTCQNWGQHVFHCGRTIIYAFTVRRHRVLPGVHVKMSLCHILSGQRGGVGRS